MVLEYIVGGEFFTHLRKAGRFDNTTAKFYAAQVAMIFDYLHRQVRVWTVACGYSARCVAHASLHPFRGWCCHGRTSSTAI
jgi:hypothetical protein